MVVKKEEEKNLHKNDLEKKANHKLHRTTGTKFRRKKSDMYPKGAFFLYLHIFLWMCVSLLPKKWHFLAELCLEHRKNAPRDYLSEGKNAEFSAAIESKKKSAFVDMQNSVS
jgi:hypothetical protein